MEKVKYHFIAIGGIGMSGLAKYLIEQGNVVSGSDICESKYTKALRDMGATVYIGHSEENLPEDCIVVASTVILNDNPEMIKARRLNLPVYHRSNLLKKLSTTSDCFIGYAGTHGKTTTSGLSAYVLEKAGLKPSFVVGGILPEINTNAQFKTEKFFVAELDESDGTVVKYSPKITVINNLEADHLDFYKNGLDSLVETFEKFLSKLDKNAKVIINNDCSGTKMLKGFDFLTFGLNEADYVAKNILYSVEGTSFDVFKNGKFLTQLQIKLIGKHNVYNALGVLASLDVAGVDLDLIKPHFATFTGMGRRFQYIGEINGAVIYDDYAHHPSEIKAILSAVAEFKEKNVIAVFQPHRYSRLNSLWDEFLDSFSGVSKVFVTDVYSASENAIEGVNSQIFVEEFSKKYDIPCKYISGKISDVAEVIRPVLKENDILVGLGAGTITSLGYDLLKG